MFPKGLTKEIKKMQYPKTIPYLPFEELDKLPHATIEQVIERLKTGPFWAAVGDYEGRCIHMVHGVDLLRAKRIRASMME